MKQICGYPWVIFVLLLEIVFGAPNTGKGKKSSDLICTTEGCKRAARVILEHIDLSVDPCDNFYKFACGGFIKSNTIPPDKPGVTPYTFINDMLQDRLKALFEEDYHPGEITPFKSVKRFYKACMDTELIENVGLEPAKKLLETLGGWPVLEGEKWKGDNFVWTNITSKLKSLGIFHSPFLAISVDSHLKNSTLRMVSIEQAQLGAYQEVLTAGINSTTVQAYLKLMTNLAVIFGADKQFAEEEMLAALNLEIDIAKVSTPSGKLRNINLLYNPTTLSEMEVKYPSVSWTKFANDLFGIDGQIISSTETINVQLPQFITDLIEILNKTPKRVQANYAIWRAVKSVAPYLTKQVLEELQNFERQRVGVKNRKQRWQECVMILSDKLPTLIGAMYIRKHFTPIARDQVNEIVHSIKRAFTQVVKDVDWMDADTKRIALLKVKNMLSYIGYSDELMNDEILNNYYSTLQLDSNNLLQLALNSKLFSLRLAGEHLREIIPRGDWRARSTPAVINAYYMLVDNIMEFPAAILQDVYFDENRPRYSNFGGIGFLIGHEITHGFDDQGRQFDESGNLVDWWDKETAQAFVEKARCIIDQYSNFTVPELGLKLNGVYSQGENIADNGAAKEAYLAYQSWVKSHHAEPLLPGLNYTQNQLFWISAANIWCSNYNAEYTKLLVLTNAHCPSEFRVIGAFQNIDHFSKDFNCPVGSPMNPVKKCKVW